MEKLPDPVWNIYLGVSAAQNKFVIAPTESELQFKAKEFGLSKKACLARIGTVGPQRVYEILQGKMTPGKLAKVKDIVGFWPIHNWIEVSEKGFKHKMFLPQHGCFGFINGNLILGNRHHQEVMFRLIQDKGWTWEQLMNAEQVWGWYHHSGGNGTARFSSDAGSMTSKKVKKACIATFSDWFGAVFKEDPNGYGGLSKDNYGGNFKQKYGDPETGEFDGYKTEYESTIITPLPDPPEA